MKHLYFFTTSLAVRIFKSCLLLCFFACCISKSLAQVQAPGNALYFNGSSYVSIPAGTLTVSGNFTVEAWVMPVSTTGNMSFFSTGVFNIRLTGNTGVHADIISGLGRSADVSYTFTPNRWYHIACVVNTLTWIIYINGIRQDGDLINGTTKNPLLLTSASNTIYIGSRNNTDYFNGNIDGVKVWNVARTSSDINADMLSPGASNVVSYSFDEGVAGAANEGINQLVDSSANNLTGTLNNFAFTAGNNWVESYAMVKTTAAGATNVTDSGFTANWAPPANGVVDNYYLDVSLGADFDHIIPGYYALPVTGTSYDVKGLQPGGLYSYRVQPYKASVGPGLYSDAQYVFTNHAAISFSPTAAVTSSVVTIHGTGFTGAAEVTFGGSPAASFAVVDDNTITAIVGAGATGRVAVKVNGSTYTIPGFEYLGLTMQPPPGNALNFDGVNDYVSSNAFTTVTGYSSTGFSTYTVEAWVKPSATIGLRQNILSLFARASGGITPTSPKSVFDLTIVNASVTAQAVTDGNTFVPVSGSGAAAGIGPFKPGHWYHVAVAVNGPSYTVYLNGKVAASGTAGASLVLFTYDQEDIFPMVFGQGLTSGSLSTANFKGSIDEVKFWTATRTQQQVQSDMVTVPANAATEPGLFMYYNFDNQGTAGADNTGLATTAYVRDLSVNRFADTLHNFALTDTTGNWVRSYAMAIPTLNISNISTKSFSLNWSAPVIDTVNNYVLDVASNSVYFSGYVAGYEAIVVNGTTQQVTGLAPATTYYYRVRADKTSLTGQGAYASGSVTTSGVTSFSPQNAGVAQTITIKGVNFTGATSVTFGGVAAASFTVVDSATITAVTGNGESGYVTVTFADGAKDSLAGFIHAGSLAVINSFSPVSASVSDTVTIYGKYFTTANAVSFGGTPALSFSVVSDSVIKALPGKGSGGSVSITTLANTVTAAGFTIVGKTAPGNALNFNGTSNYASITTTGPTVSAFTVEAWVRPLVINGNSTILCTSNSNGTNHTFELKFVNSNTIKLRVASADTWLVDANAAYSFTMGSWYHIACAVNGAGYRMYVNGALVGSGSYTSTRQRLLDAGHNYIYIGNNSPLYTSIGIPAGDEYFNGSIDEIKIWSNLARSQAQIMADMQTVVNPYALTPGLYAFINFDEGNAASINTSTNVLYNYGTSKIDAALYNFALTGSTSNWVESYAMVAPVVSSATNIRGSRFTANWQAPTIGTAESYLLDVATDAAFTNKLTSYNGLAVQGTSKEVTGLTAGTRYWYRVRANKSSVEGQGTYSDTVSVVPPNIDNSSNNALTICSTELPYNWNGQSLTMAGTYTDTLTNVAGGDSTVTLRLTVTEATSSSKPVTICASSLPYNWNGTDYNAAGSYTIHLANKAGCDSAATLVLTVVAGPATATLKPAGNNFNVCYGNNRTIATTVTGGASPYLYSLDGTTYQSAGSFIVHAGDYTVTVKDANGCTLGTNSVTITQPAVKLKVVSIQANDGSGITVNATGGFAGYTYSINGGAYQASNVFTGITGASAVTVKDLGGCTATGSISAIIPTVRSATGSNNVCYGAGRTIIAAATGGIKPYQYSLNGGAYQASPNFVVKAGTYTITVMDAAGATANTGNITIVQPAAKLAVPIFQPSGSDIAVLASGGFGGYTYSADGVNYQSSNVFTGLVAGTAITVKDLAGCTAIGKLTALSATLKSAGNNNNVCYGYARTVTATATGGFAPYQYSIDGGVYQTSASFVVNAGSHTVTVMDAARATVTTNSVTISQPEVKLYVALTKTDVSCNGASDGTITASATGGFGGYLYSTNNISYQASGIFNNLQAGTLNVYVKDAIACVTNKTITITQPVSPCSSLDAGDDAPTSANAGMTGALKVKVLPNPATIEFNLQVVSGNSKKVIEIRVMDMQGKTVYHTRGSVFDTYQFGRGFASGMYVAEVLNGSSLQRIKLVKGN